MKTKVLLTALMSVAAAALMAAPVSKNLIQNPSFEGKVNAKGVPASWGLDKANIAKVVKNSDGTHSLQLSGQFLRQIIFGVAFCPKTAKAFELKVKASGSGRLYVAHARFTRIKNENGKTTNKFLKTDAVMTITLTGKMTEYKGKLTIPEGEFCQLLFRTDKNTALIDEVSVTEIPAEKNKK